MYSIDTQFLTKHGWKFATDLKDSDRIAFEVNTNLSWLKFEDLQFKIHEFEIDMLECLVSRAGKICVTPDKSIRFFSENRKGTHEHSRTLSEIIEYLSNEKYMSEYAHIRFDHLKVERNESNKTVYQIARVLFQMFPRIHHIDRTGLLHFPTSGYYREEAIFAELEQLGVPRYKLEVSEGNSMVTADLGSFRNYVEACITYSSILKEPIQNMTEYVASYRGEEAEKIMHTKRFYCPNLTELGQLVLAFSGYCTKTYRGGAETTTKKEVLRVCNANNRGMSFRSKVIILNRKIGGVSVNVPHPLTRYDGRIAIL